MRAGVGPLQVCAARRRGERGGGGESGAALLARQGLRESKIQRLGIDLTRGTRWQRCPTQTRPFVSTGV